MTALAKLLHTLEEQLVRIGMPSTDWLGPSRSHEDVETALRSTGWSPNEELVDWFTWHDGTRGPDNESMQRRLCPMGYRLLSLDEALSQRDVRREVIEQTFAGDDDPPYGWDDRWLPLGVAGHGGILVAEVDPGDPERVRLLQLEWDAAETFDEIRAESLTEAVECWINLVREHCRWVGPPAMWELDYAAIGYGPLPGVL